MTDIPVEEVIRNVERAIKNAKPHEMTPYAQNITAPDYPFVALAKQTADALVEATQRVVTDATNLLERNKAYAEQYLGDINKRAEELREVEDRQRAFGEATLNAHEKYSANGSKQ